MKTLHLVEPRIGPDNAGSPNCLRCGATVFAAGGAVAYDPESEGHTTDEATYEAAGEGDLEDLQRCVS